ncbi:MAG: hypothetical protein ACOC9Y_04310 [Chloroflexota bacterium]
MDVRRVDFWHVKPGRLKDFVEDFNEFFEECNKLGTFGRDIRLVQISAGGQAPMFSHYWFGDWDSMEAYGAFIDEARDCDDLQEKWRGFFAEDSPAAHAGTSIVLKLAELGAPAPAKVGATAVVRTWRTKPGQHGTLIDIGKKMEPHWKKFNGHSEAWRAEFAGPFSGNVITSTVFPDSRTLGKWMDYATSNEEIQRIIDEMRTGSAPPEMLSSGIASAIALGS